MAQRQIVIYRENYSETRIQNRIIWDDSLSTAARFSLIAMLSLPDTWDFSVRGMAVKLGVSKDTMSKYLRELETAGYLKRVQQHGGEGKFSSAEYILTDTPGSFGEEDAGEPCPNFSDTEAQPCPNFSAPVNSPQKKRTKQENLKEKKIKKEKKDPSKPAWKPERFESFWVYYRTNVRKEDRQGAVRAWDKLRPDDELIAVMGKALRVQLASEEWRKGIGIPYAKTWLNNRRWEDVSGGAAGTGKPKEEVRRYGWE